MTTVDFRRANRINDIRRVMGEREPDVTETRIEALYKATGGETLHDNQWAMLLNLIQAEPEKPKLSATKALNLAAKAKALVKVQRVDANTKGWQVVASNTRTEADERYGEIRGTIVMRVMTEGLMPEDVAEMLDQLAPMFPQHRDALAKEASEYREHPWSWLDVKNAQDARRSPNGA